MNSGAEEFTEVSSAATRVAARHGSLISAVHRGDLRLIGQFGPAWLELCARAVRDEPFFHPQWIAAYLRAFAPDCPFLLAAAHRGARLEAVLPLVGQTALFCGLPARILRGAANVHSCRFDLVREPGPGGDDAVGALWRSLKNLPRWDVIEIPYAPEAAAAEQLLHLAEAEGYPTGRYGGYPVPFIRLAGVSDPMAIPHRAGFRKNLRRMRRNAEARGLHFIRAEQVDRSALEELYALEGSGWKHQTRTAMSCQPATRAFYDEVSTFHGPGGCAEIYLMRFGDTPVGATLVVEHRQTCYGLKLGWNESYAAFAPGHLILTGVLGDILPRGFREYDLTGPMAPWKAEWTADTRYHRVLYIFQKSLYGRALYLAKMKAKATARRLAGRISRRPVA